MRNVLLAALVLVTVACGAYRFPGSTPTPTAAGTVRGTVVSVPCSPVEAANQPCGGRPLAGVELDFTHVGAAAKAVTDSTGHYNVTLDSGTWTVHLVARMSIISGPAQVTVTPGSTVSANYVLDSGIRVPVPAPQQ